MTTATASPSSALQLDPRLVAFSGREGPEIFTSVVHQHQVWRADPFDVPTIHAEARIAFDRLLNRASAADPPEFGKILLLRGESGSGKTHLMRAFRASTHADNRGYFAYLQMTAEASSYARYLLCNLIDSLNHPYRDPEILEPGLIRLALGLLDAVPGLSADARQQFRDGHVPDLVSRVFEFADWVVTDSRFDADALDLYRALLFMLRDDNRVKGRALKWLRCEELTPHDRELIGHLAPRTQAEDPLWMIRKLGRLMNAVQDAPLVICLDQLEEVLAKEGPQERFQQIVDTIAAIVTAIPRVVAVVACLDEYYITQRQSLRKPHLDRLEHDPEPVVLKTARSLEEIDALVAKRLEVLYEDREVAIPPSPGPFPFKREHFESHAGQRTRDILDFCRVHRDRCIAAGQWLEPSGSAPSVLPTLSPSSITLDQAWNEAVVKPIGAVPDEEPHLAALLAAAIQLCSSEMPEGAHFGAEMDGRFIQVEAHAPDNTVDRFLVGLCEKPAVGGGLGKQVAELAKRAGEVPVVIARSTVFSASPTAKVTTEILKLIEPKGRGRRIVVENSDWRAMLAFQAFHKAHGKTAGFNEWQRQSRPLSQLPSLRRILALDRLEGHRAVPAASKAVQAKSPSPKPPAPILEANSLLLGTSFGLRAESVSLDREELKYHAAFLGATGSGKTTVALNLIEQLLGHGVPALLIDRKGDLCRYAEPSAWERPLEDSAECSRRTTLRQRIEITVYTPGKADGRPLALPLAPGLDELSTAEREQFAGYAAAGLGSMLGYKPTAAQRPRLAILGKAIEVLSSTPGIAVTLDALRQLVDDRDDTLLAAVDGFDDRHYRQLGEDLLTLKLSQGYLFAADAESVDPDVLFGCGAHARPGKTSLTIISTRFLGDASRVDFWVAQLLVSLGRWISKSPSPNLQGVVLFDEADQYLPATRQPATKAPLENLLRRARSAGLGVLLATQSPGDLDYKCRDNIRTWLVGRVREKVALDKLRSLFSESSVDVASRLPNQGTGEFHLLQEKKITSLRAHRSFVATEQVPDDRILELARTRRA